MKITTICSILYIFQFYSTKYFLVNKLRFCKFYFKSVIRFEGVSKIYSTDVVLKNINWEIKKGEKIGLVGSNGAGKSTQFKI